MRRSKALRRARIREDMGLGKSPAKPHWYERSGFLGPVTVFNLTIAIINLAAVLYGVHAIREEFSYREDVDRPLAQDTMSELSAARSQRAFATLADPNLPLQIKGYALEELSTIDDELSHISMSCVDLYGSADQARRWGCDGLRGGELVALEIDGGGAGRFVDLTFDNMSLPGSILVGFECVDCSFVNTSIEALEVRNIGLVLSDLSGLQLDAEMIESLSLRGSNLSGALIALDSASDVDLTDAWFWEDRPPFFAGRGYSSIFSDFPEDLGALYDIRARAYDEALAAGVTPCPQELRQMREQGALPAEAFENVLDLETQNLLRDYFPRDLRQQNGFTTLPMGCERE